MPSDDDATQQDRPPTPSADLTTDRPRPSPFDRAFNTNVRAWRARRRWWVLTAVAALVLVGWAVAAYRDGHVIPRINAITDDRVALQQKVAAALPIGSTKAQVAAWLNGQGIAYGSIGELKTNKPIGFGGGWHYSNWMEQHGSVQMEFYFDDDDKLVNETVDIFIPSF